MEVIQIFSGDDKKDFLFNFRTPIVRGERSIRCFYALGDIDGWLGTLAATLETRGKFPTSLALTFPALLTETFFEVDVYKRDWLVD